MEQHCYASLTAVPTPLFGAACSCAFQGGSWEASAMAKQSRHGGTLGTCPHATLLPGLTRAGVASRPLLQHSSKIYEISHKVGLGEHRKSFSSLKSPKLPKSSSRRLNSTIIFLDNVIELFLVIAAGEIQMVSPIFSAAYIQEQLQESECKLYFIHGQSIPSKNLLLNNLDNFFFFLARTNPGCLAILKYQNRQVSMVMTVAAKSLLHPDFTKISWKFKIVSLLNELASLKFSPKLYF